MYQSLNSLKGVPWGLYRGVLQGLLRRILGVFTIAHVRVQAWENQMKHEMQVVLLERFSGMLPNMVVPHPYYEWGIRYPK